ncbi:MAG: hypothetical protein ABL982_26015 [Vicinamibacterales bacterium]
MGAAKLERERLLPLRPDGTRGQMELAGRAGLVRRILVGHQVSRDRRTWLGEVDGRPGQDQRQESLDVSEQDVGVG